jgi:hypothetical protein
MHGDDSVQLPAFRQCGRRCSTVSVWDRSATDTTGGRKLVTIVGSIITSRMANRPVQWSRALQLPFYEWSHRDFAHRIGTAKSGLRESIVARAGREDQKVLPQRLGAVKGDKRCGNASEPDHWRLCRAIEIFWLGRERELRFEDMATNSPQS